MEGIATTALTKAQRINLTNRRTVAFILELIPVNVAGGIILSFVSSSSQLLPYAPFTAWMIVRDLGTRSWGKRVVGLDIASADGSRYVSPKARILRNLFTGIIPLLPVIEYFYVYYSNRRIGDRVAGTSVVDCSPERSGKGSWSAQLVLALIGNLVVLRWLLPYLLRLIHQGHAG